MRTTLRVVGMLLAVFLVGRSDAAAQVPGIDVNIGVRGGWFTPIGIVGEDASQRESKLSQGFAFGASIELDIPLSPINVRANVDATMGRALEVEGLEVPGTEIDMIALTGDIVFRPVPRVILAQPYFLVGAGLKKYSTEGSFEDTTDFTGHLGAGADLSLGVVSLMVEISDYISAFNEVPSGDSRLQNDVFIMAGFKIGLF
jgi:hypothetical protein